MFTAMKAAMEGGRIKKKSSALQSKKVSAKLSARRRLDAVPFFSKRGGFADANLKPYISAEVPKMMNDTPAAITIPAPR